MTSPALPPENQNQGLVRVLIVDDMPQVLRDLRQLLELTGHIEVVAEACNGAEAVRLAEKLSPEVVVMDLEMPGMDGFEATRLIKSQQLARRVVILSVHADAREREQARAVGADGFVVKGVNYQILMNAILARDGLSNTFDALKGESL